MHYEDGAKIENIYAGKISKPFPARKKVKTAFIKTSIESSQVDERGLIDDEQGFKYHGGVDRAVNHFPQEDYEHIKREFPECSSTLCAGNENGFGENISTTGGNLNLHTVCIGDQFSVGSCIFEVCQPRYPCGKVDVRHNANGIREFVLQNGLNGWFYRVIQKGEIKVGDTFKRIHHPYPELSLYKIQIGLYGKDEELEKNIDFLKQISEIETLPEKQWKAVARQKLANLQPKNLNK